MKQLAYLILFFFIYFSLFSQTQKGFVILNNNEKIDGFITLKSENKNPVKINFSRDQNGQSTVYTVNDLKSFEIIDVDRYLRADVLVDMRPYNSSKNVPLKLDSFRRETVWLRVLSTGKNVSLYELLSNRSHYFIADANGEFKELIYKVGRENDQRYEIKTYIIQLQKYLEKANPQAGSPFLRTRFTQYDLVKAVGIINEDSTTNATLERDLKIHYTVFAGAGIGTAKTKLTSSFENIGDVKFENKIFPYVTAGVDFYPGRKPGQVAIRFDITYSSVDHRGTAMHPLYRETVYELKQTDIKPALSGLFNFVNRQHLKLYAGPSLSYHLSSYKGNEYIFSYPSEFHYKDFLSLRKNWMSIDARAGAIINKAVEVSLKAEVIGKMQTNKRYDFTSRQYTVGVAYHFLRKL